MSGRSTGGAFLSVTTISRIPAGFWGYDCRMPLGRAWMRGLWGASGVAVLVPGGIIAAMVLLALSGSFGRIAGLGQAFSGPAPPNVTSGPSTAGTGGKQGSTLLAALAVPATAAPVAAARPGITGGRSVTNTRPGAPTGRPPGSRGPGTPQPPKV